MGASDMPIGSSAFQKDFKIRGFIWQVGQKDNERQQKDYSGNEIISGFESYYSLPIPTKRFRNHRKFSIGLINEIVFIQLRREKKSKDLQKKRPEKHIV